MAFERQMQAGGSLATPADDQSFRIPGLRRHASALTVQAQRARGAAQVHDPHGQCWSDVSHDRCRIRVVLTAGVMSHSWQVHACRSLGVPGMLVAAAVERKA